MNETGRYPMSEPTLRENRACVHCGMGLLGTDGDGPYFIHENHLWRCQGGPDGSVPYYYMGHPSMPCPDDPINPCIGVSEDHCDHVMRGESDG